MQTHASASFAGHNAWLKHRAAAVNPRNLTGRGLARDNGAWALASSRPATPDPLAAIPACLPGRGQREERAGGA